ncbi:uncharacterized protein LOC132724575 [Ruditapes philippinarum]|uniref:uncharacterized protein LOC132724575 n=1 Tax=Ruditapes philippinarum TaxID=129788 RepID=UPI00295AC9CC|nr:uncharacterized protein LOC132724575 [Ruditapes philippinarum]
MTQYQNQSILISNLLTDIGYGKQMIAFRRKIYKDITAENYNNEIHSGLSINRFVVGSKAEGVTAPLENDLDVMEVLPDAVCKEHSNLVAHEEQHQFKLVLEHSRPGYSLLRTVIICNRLPTATLFYESMVELAPNSLYLSSDFLKNKMKNLRIEISRLPGNQEYINVKEETQGPSVVSNRLALTSEDDVMALKCECPGYLSSWICRSRNYQWPPAAVIREVSSLDSHVVPVGHTASFFQFLEWRICFTKGEIKLVHSLNDCLTKVFILLKQIPKVTLKPLSKDMSTYLMKNVVFWLAELNDYNYFTQHALLIALKKALAYLKHFVVTNNFPSYMIPQRNLLEGKLTHSQRIKICMRIDSLLKEGPYIVLKIAKIRTAFSILYRSPTEFNRVSKNLHEIQIIIHFIDYIHLSVQQIPRTFGEMMRIMLTNRKLRFLLVRLHLHMCDINNETLSYEDIEELYNTLNIPESIDCDIQNDEKMLQLVSYLT